MFRSRFHKFMNPLSLASWRVRAGALVALGLAALTLPILAAAGDDAPGSGSVAAEKCPAANAEFEAAGINPPDSYTPGCPEDAKQFGEDLEAATQKVTAAQKAMMEAVEQGRIHEDQDPYTYPPDLQEAIGLEDDPPGSRG